MGFGRGEKGDMSYQETEYREYDHVRGTPFDARHGVRAMLV